MQRSPSGSNNEELYLLPDKEPDVLGEQPHNNLPPSCHPYYYPDGDSSDDKEQKAKIREIEKTFLTKRELVAALGTTAETLPEVNYWAFSIFETVLSELCHVIAKPGAGVGIGWNAADAACQGVTGILQWCDETTHRPMVTKAKGTANILSGLQLGILTGISFSAYGAPAFAAAFGVGFALSLDDTCCAARRYLSTDYLIEDNIARLKKNVESMEILNNEINEAQDQLDALVTERDNLSRKGIPIPMKLKSGIWLLDKVITSKEKRLKDLGAQQRELQDETIFTFAAEKHKNKAYNHDDIINLIDENFTDLNVEFRDALEEIHNAESEESSQKISDIQYEPLSEPYRMNETQQVSLYLNADTCSDKINVRNRRLLTTVAQEASNSLIWGLAFGGMLLSCIPGLHPIGAALIVVASAMFLMKHGGKLGKFLFFSDKKSSGGDVDSDDDTSTNQFRNTKTIL